MATTSILTSRDCEVYKFDFACYRTLAKFQEDLRESIISGGGGNTILFVQHLPVISMGASGDAKDILVTDDFLNKMNIDIVRADRGGKVTYHGPGQLVVYLILDLRQVGKDVHLFIRNLEEVVIRTLSDFSLSASRHQGYPGVWIGEDKICSIGIDVKRWVTKHGLALNINNDLAPFSYINPCGIGRNVTSIKKLLGMELSVEEVSNIMLRHFSELLDLNVIHRSN